MSCQESASKSWTQEFLESPDQLLLLTLLVTDLCWFQPVHFNILRCFACCRPSRTWITLNRFSTIFEVFVPHFYLCCTQCIIPKSLLNHPNTFCKRMFELNANFDADWLFYLLSHFECNGHTVHMLTQWHLLSPLTGTVKLSVFMYVHSSPPSLAARLHLCHANHSHYINNGWTFFRQIFKTWFKSCLLIESNSSLISDPIERDFSSFQLP